MNFRDKNFPECPQYRLIDVYCTQAVELKMQKMYCSFSVEHVLPCFITEKGNKMETVAES